MCSDIDTCFDFDCLESRSLVEIETSPLTEQVCRYSDFETVLENVGDMYYNVEVIAGTCGISKQEVRRQLLQKELISVLRYFDYWQTEEVKEQYIDIYRAYEKCLMSEQEYKNLREV